MGPAPTGSSTKDVEENRLVAALSWLWVLSIIILLVKKDSPFVRFHARQAFVLFLASVFLWIIIVLMAPAAWVFLQLLQLVVFVASVAGFVQAFRGQWWVLPVLGPLAPKIRL